MTSIIRLQPFSGAEGESPPCYMLQVDEFRFLLDCGWDEEFSLTYIEQLKKHCHQIDAVLLTYPDPYHLGALPYMVGRCGLNCPIYATIPVYKMGQMFMYDLYQSRHNSEDFDMFTLDDVDAAFDKIQQLKYSQTVGLKGKGHGLQITPLPAGHMLGGTLWKIVKDGEEEIVYAIDYNHKKERHLNGCILDSINRPSIFITDAFNADYVQARRRVRDEQLMTTIVQTMRNDGNVLIATDTAGRVLELAQLLDQMWRTQESGLMAYSLALLNNVSYNVVEFAKSQMEWMSDKIMRAFEDRRNNPFQFKHVQLCHSLAELHRVPEPKVVLASSPDLQSGFSRDLFTLWCNNEKNAIILTNRTSPGTLARYLIDNPDMKDITIKLKRRVRLDGEELAEHQKKEKEKEEEEKSKAEQLKKEAGDLDSSDESEGETEVEQGTGTKITKHDLMVKSETKSRASFFKQTRKTHPMFPVYEEKIKWDDYGEIIRPDDYRMDEVPLKEEEDKDDHKYKKIEEDMAPPPVQEVPTKCVSQATKLTINCNVSFIDFEGRSDGESIRKILAQVKPRQLILVHGSQESTENLAEYARNAKDMVQGSVLVPRLLENIDATTESHIYQVKLLDSLVSKLQFSKARDAELTWIDAKLDMSKAKIDTGALDVSETENKPKPDKDKPDKDKTEGAEGDTDVEMEEEKKEEESEPMDLVPTLVPVRLTEVRGHIAVFVNEPRLSDFKQVLVREGIQAEFSGGVLICNNVVAVRRNDIGKMQIEGTLCEDFYRVQKLLYQQYAIV